MSGTFQRPQAKISLVAIISVVITGRIMQVRIQTVMGLGIRCCLMIPRAIYKMEEIGCRWLGLFTT